MSSTPTSNTPVRSQDAGQVALGLLAAARRVVAGMRVGVVAALLGLAEGAAVVEAVPEGLDGRQRAAEDQREGLDGRPQEGLEIVPGRVLCCGELREIVGFYDGAGGGAGGQVRYGFLVFFLEAKEREKGGWGRDIQYSDAEEGTDSDALL